MTVAWQEELRPGEALREIVQQATAALIRMDADRLEELARCCADLNREIEQGKETIGTVRDLRSSENDVKVLGRILDETRANYMILSRLFSCRRGDAGAATDTWPDPQVGSAARSRDGWSGADWKEDYGDN
jgi:hypothetical protein